jgi:type II secretory pathway component PulM
MRVGRARHSFIAVSGWLLLIRRSLVAGSEMGVSKGQCTTRALPAKRTMTDARINQWNSKEGSMRVITVAAMAIVVTCVAYEPTASARPASMQAESPRSAAQAEQVDFNRPDVAPLPAEGKFQVVSDTAWAGNKVRVFFLGAQF